MAKRTAMHLREHLSVFEAGYPIQKGYIAQLLIRDGRGASDVLREVKSIVHANEPGKLLQESTLVNNLYIFKKLIIKKKKQLTKEWPLLITLFLEPFPITFKPVVPVSSQPVDASVPSPSRNPDPSTSLTLEMLLEPGIPVTSTLMQAVQNSTTNNSPFCLMTCKLPSPRKLKSDCANCVNKQRTIMNVMQKNTYLIKQIKQFKPLFEAENRNFLDPITRLNETIKRKTQSITNWKTKYASLSNACRNTHKLLKLVQSLEQQVKTLEGKLTAAQEENINMASVNEQLQSLLEKTEKDNVNLKNVHEQLKCILEKAGNNDLHMKQVHEQLRSILAKTESDAHFKQYSQASHSPEMEIKEESPWEAADNYGGNLPLQNEEIKQEQIYEEHSERSRWKKTYISDDENTAVPMDVTSNISMKDLLCGERCQVEAEGDCLDHGPSIYIDNAEVPCKHISHEDVIQTITAEEKIDQPNLFSENEATSSYTQLCYANSHTDHAENGKHQSTLGTRDTRDY